MSFSLLTFYRSPDGLPYSIFKLRTSVYVTDVNSAPLSMCSFFIRLIAKCDCFLAECDEKRPNTTSVLYEKFQASTI